MRKIEGGGIRKVKNFKIKSEKKESDVSLEYLKDILGSSSMFLFNDQMVYKMPNDNLEFAAHYDNQYGAENKSGDMHTVNVSWILDDFTKENGALSLKSLDDDQWTTVFPKAGDIIAINGNCYHQSGINNSDKPRGLYACVYLSNIENYCSYALGPGH